MNSRQATQMRDRLFQLLKDEVFSKKNIFIFGHCHASEVMADMFLRNGIRVCGIIDNNKRKWGLDYYGISICQPQTILSYDNAAVCIASRFYEEMYKQLRELGFSGDVLKLVDYNTYAEYSLSDYTIQRKKVRLELGLKYLQEIDISFPGCFRVFCPFEALGDVYLAMSYLPHFLRKIKRSKAVVIVPSRSCADVVGLFSCFDSYILEQNKLDATIQATIYSHDKDSFIAHQDRPYVVDVSYMLHAMCIPLEDLYRIGIFGLEKNIEPVIPGEWHEYHDLDKIPRSKSVILSPYAKSVVSLADVVWEEIIKYYKRLNYKIFTNVYGDEKPLDETNPISPKLCEMKSVVEHAGTFVGIRSGLCDVIRTADAKKFALYPDYYYSDTKWKAIDMYSLPSFENIVVKEGFEWRNR